ncbi:MAG: glucuronate isomerase [Candidatus Atribacteria bacterium ADurb.Bin276]|jgi:hypothetical protein|uniref:Glucuronate isomerase n=1 Tax=Candidatus Atribacter allofermentans TaxID=1852833 RepID=A0A1V5SJV6_9BACT|nr:MAG: glucuronate isomerase [Candidatus Atribacteria bacterium ADurb.Bin276]
MKYFENLLHSIKELPIFDVHSHISIDQPQCRDLSDILFYHFMRRELYSAGLKDDNYLVSNTPFEERIGEFFKYKPLVENTTTFWCIKKILNDIYHVTDGDIRPDNWKDLQQQIIQKGRDFSYPKSILNRMNVQCSLICENHWSQEGLARNQFLIPLYEDLDLFHFDPTRNLSLLDLIAKEYGGLPENSDQAQQSIYDFFKKKSQSGIRYFTAFISSAFHLIKPVSGQINEIYDKKKTGTQLSAEENHILFTWLFYSYLEALQSIGTPAQFVIGAYWARPGMRYGESYVWNNHQLSLDLVEVFKDFPKISMSLMFASLSMAQEFTIIARMLPNVSLLGFWWHTLIPNIIEQLISQRIESLPSNKWIAIATDAYSVEWAYGKVSLVLHCLARVLSQKVEEGYFTEKTAIEYARRILYENPQEIYQLKLD